jgi:hypothetical protein
MAGIGGPMIGKILRYCGVIAMAFGVAIVLLEQSLGLVTALALSLSAVISGAALIGFAMLLEQVSEMNRRIGPVANLLSDIDSKLGPVQLVAENLTKHYGLETKAPPPIEQAFAADPKMIRVFGFECFVAPDESFWALTESGWLRYRNREAFEALFASKRA